MDKFFGHVVANPDGTSDFTVLPKPINDQIAAEFDLITQAVLQAQPLAIGYAVCEEEFEALVRWPDQGRDRLSKYLGLDIPIFVVSDLMTEEVRRVTAYLGAASALLGQATKHISEKFGADSVFFKEWNTLRQLLHGSSVGYRIMYELRNFAQHYALPLSEFRVSGTNDVHGRMLMSCGAHMDRDALLASGYDWKTRRTDIEKLETKFDLLPLAGDYQRCLRRLVIEVTSAYEADFRNCADYLTKLRCVLKAPANARIWLFDGPGVGGQPPTAGRIVPEEQFSWILTKLSRAGGEMSQSRELPA